jgi:hypothetical protein
MTRLKTILNKYKETRMAKPKFRMQETYSDFTEEQMADMMKRMSQGRGAGETLAEEFERSKKDD